MNPKQIVIQSSDNQYFRERLLAWNETVEHRTLPWRAEKNPYKVWLSEIILQQTRVEQGLSYYESFVRKYPSICSLAEASDDEVFALWAGLGYYNRCRNLLHTARYICSELDGKFPKTYEEIRALKGIGDYSAAAISSFAYALPHAVVDGNVVRVLSRFFGINELPIRVQQKRMYQELANRLLDVKVPGVYNQAIMDFGATMCKPKLAKCSSCPLSKRCYAYNEGVVHQFPPKKEKLVLKKRNFHYLISEDSNLYLRKRVSKDIWQNLYEPILFEGELPASLKSKKVYAERKQKLSHQEIRTFFYKISSSEIVNYVEEDYTPYSLDAMQSLPFPTSIRKFFKEEDYLKEIEK